jgi:UDP-N-acetylglucosamine--N-acetylmuramyl-(pentapeptide) pyrophosphoryl-undecaprenol N-acetylglucosamine transferase
MKILAVGGGSGGHVTPVAAVIEQLAKHHHELVVTFVCDKAFESQSRGIMEHVSVPVTVKTITAGKFRRYANLSLWQHLMNWQVVTRNTTDIFKIIIGFFQSLWILLRFRPDVVFAKGGYVCMPMGLAARILGYPLVIHDSDTRPGLTNRVLARFATTITTGAPLENYSYDKQKSHYVGVPIDDSFRPVAPEAQAKYKENLGVGLGKKLVVAFGGGLGAQSINDAMPSLAKRLQADEVVVYNITGKMKIERAEQKGKGIQNYIAVPFVYEGMFKVLAAADLVITRASATSLQELAGLAKPVIVVPATHLGDQQKNAKVFAAAGGVKVLSDHDLTQSDIVSDLVKELLSNKKERERLATSLHAFARPDAAEDLAHFIDKAARH